MKNLIIVLTLLITTSLFAQEKVAVDSDISVDQSRGWMTKIAADPEMRVQMLEMMIKETEGNHGEMMKLVNSINNNPEVKKMLSEKKSERSGMSDMKIESRGMEKESSTEVKMIKAKGVSKKIK